MQVFDPDLVCPLCSVRPALHNGKRYTKREHVPPKSVFLNPTNRMVTVPACAECNAGTAAFDEEFKAQLGLYLGWSRKSFWQSALRTIQHPHKKS